MFSVYTCIIILDLEEKNLITCSRYQITRLNLTFTPEKKNSGALGNLILEDKYQSLITLEANCIPTPVPFDQIFYTNCGRRWIFKKRYNHDWSESVALGYMVLRNCQGWFICKLPWDVSPRLISSSNRYKRFHDNMVTSLRHPWPFLLKSNKNIL